MTDEGVIVHLDGICPCLGLAEGSAIRYLGASSLHRCHSEAGSLPVSVREQETYCLSGSYPSCPRWQNGGELAELEEDASLFGWDWGELRDRTSRVAWELLAGLVRIAWALLAVGAFIVLAPLLGAPDPGAGTGGNGSSPSPTAEPAAWSGAPSELATLTPTNSGASSEALAAGPVGAVAASPSVPRATPGRNPGSAPSPVATALSAPQRASSTPMPGARSYVVQSKDTLWSVARAFGVTVDDLVKANGLKDANVLRAGQTLTIPEPRRRP